MSWIDDLGDTLSGWGDTVNEALPGDLTVGDIFASMWSGAKDKALTSISTSLANNPAVQAQVKTTTGNKLGNWLLDNWFIPVGIIAAGILAFFMFRRK